MKTYQQILPNFIVLEGLDGSGTTTQLTLLEDQLLAKGIPYHSTFEPTKNDTGMLIRRVLKGEQQLHHDTLGFLFAADRNEHLYDPLNGIIHHHSKGNVVICDRYIFSSLAYQSTKTDFEFVLFLNSLFPLPSHVFFLEVPIEICMKRLESRKQKEIYENSRFQATVLKGYIKALNYYADSKINIHKIDGTLPHRQKFLLKYGKNYPLCR